MTVNGEDAVLQRCGKGHGSEETPPLENQRGEVSVNKGHNLNQFRSRCSNVETAAALREHGEHRTTQGLECPFQAAHEALYRLVCTSV